MNPFCELSSLNAFFWHNVDSVAFCKLSKKNSSFISKHTECWWGKLWARYSLHFDLKHGGSTCCLHSCDSELSLLLLREPFLPISVADWKLKMKALAPRLHWVGGEVTVEEGASQQTVFPCISFLSKSSRFIWIWFKLDLTSDLWGA